MFDLALMKASVMGFSGDAIKFIRHQTVLADMTYLSRRAVTSLLVRMRSVTKTREQFLVSYR